MPTPFNDQIRLFDDVLSGGARIAICLGSGISRGRMPMLRDLIDRALMALPSNPDAAAFFRAYSERNFFSAICGQLDPSIVASNPMTLVEYKGIAREHRLTLCDIIARTYSDFFEDYRTVIGGKRQLLEAVGIQD